MFYFDKRKIPLIIIPLILIRPLWECFERLNHKFWHVIIDFIRFFQTNALIALFLIIIIILIYTS